MTWSVKTVTSLDCWINRSSGVDRWVFDSAACRTGSFLGPMAISQIRFVCKRKGIVRDSRRRGNFGASSTATVLGDATGSRSM